MYSTATVSHPVRGLVPVLTAVGKVRLGLIVYEDDAIVLVRCVGAVDAAVAPPVDVNALAGLAKEPRGVARVRVDGKTWRRTNKPHRQF